MESRQVGSSFCVQNPAQLLVDILKENYKLIQEFLTPITDIFWGYNSFHRKIQIFIYMHTSESRSQTPGKF